ncbi:unnamed protein product, partial [Scytosiphon promiscuus]
LPGPAEVITKALVEGLTPGKFREDVRVRLQHAGNWKTDPNLVLDTVVAEAKEWRKIEAFSQSSTQTSRPASRPNSRQQGPRSAGHRDNRVCFQCGQ